MLGLIATVAQLELRLSSKVTAWPRYLLVRAGLGFWSISMYYTFFISNPIFWLSLELLSEVPQMRLKVAMKLLTFFKLLRISDSRLGSCELSGYDFRRSEARPAKNKVAYKKMCMSKDLPNCLKDGNSSMFY